MRILLIVQPERFDFYSYLAAAENVEWLLLWYEKRGQMKISEDQLPLKFQGIYYWNQFSTPTHLLNELKPDRIIFFEIIDLRQIALNVSASARKIPTFYLEHGAAGDKATALLRSTEKSFKQHKLPYLINRIKSSLLLVIRSKFFYYSVTKGFKSFSSFRKYFLLPFKMLAWGSNQVLNKSIFRERIPLKSIVFNRNNYEEYKLYTGITPQEALLTGVPFFDKFYDREMVLRNYVVYIDHPYLEENILEWTEEHHRKVANNIFEFARKEKITVYIKLHPRSDKDRWESYNYNKEFIKLIQYGDFTNLYLEAKLILGFSSSLITGFLCAKKNVVLLAWHPRPHIFGADFSKTNLCHISLLPEELKTKYHYWQANNLTIVNDGAYQEFLEQYNYPFDGKATERVIQAITLNEAS